LLPLSALLTTVTFVLLPFHHLVLIPNTGFYHA
jgi:hypothetical protein